jgi:hypothetical protein
MGDTGSGPGSRVREPVPILQRATLFMQRTQDDALVYQGAGEMLLIHALYITVLKLAFNIDDNGRWAS